MKFLLPFSFVNSIRSRENGVSLRRGGLWGSISRQVHKSTLKRSYPYREIHSGKIDSSSRLEQHRPYLVNISGLLVSISLLLSRAPMRRDLHQSLPRFFPQISHRILTISIKDLSKLRVYQFVSISFHGEVLQIVSK